MRNLLLIPILFLASCVSQVPIKDTSCQTEKLLDGYYIKYSNLRKEYAICHVVCNVSHDLIWKGDKLESIEIIRYDTSWMKYGAVEDGYTFNPYIDRSKSIAKFGDSCKAKLAFKEAIDNDNITSDFK